MNVTVRALAELAEVSPATVSRYYSGKELVSREVAQRIQKAAAQTGYIYHGRRDSVNRTVAVLLPYIRYEFFHEVLVQLERQIHSYNMDFVIFPLIPGSTNFQTLTKQLNIFGVIYLDEDMDPRILEYFSSRQIRIVMCGGTALTHRHSMVHVNDLQAAYEGANYLLKLGHRDILVLSDFPQHVDSGFQRLTGFRRAIEDSNLSGYTERVLYGMVSFENGYSLVRHYLKTARDFTAIFAFSDEMAAGAMKAVQEAGLRVPEDVSILGFDDIQLAQRVTPSLTTIHQPIDKYVAKSLELMSVIDHYEPEEVTFPFQIVERHSCRALKEEIQHENA